MKNIISNLWQQLGCLDTNYTLDIFKYTFKNRQNNLFYVKRYSTKSRKNQSVHSTLIVRHTSTNSRQREYKSVLSGLQSFLQQDSSFINNDTQIELEKFVFNQFKTWDMNKPDTKVININLDILTPKFKDIIIKAHENSKKYMSNLKKTYQVLATEYSQDLSEESIDVLISNLLNSVKSKEIIAILLSYYLRIVSFKDIDDDNFSHLGRIVINLGRQVSVVFYRELYFEYKSTVEDTKNLLRYKDWFKTLDKKTLFYHNNEELYATLGGRLIDILVVQDLLKKVYTYVSKKKSLNTLEIPEKISGLLEKKTIYSSPPKLPMIVPPKAYNKNSNGGYLLNDDYYSDEIIIEKWAYEKPS